MIEPHLDGTGGGYGKFRGKKVEEIRELFRRCEEEPTMRSVSVVLRVAREQLEARGGLGHYPIYAMIAGGVFVVTFLIKGFLPASMAQSVPKLQFGLGIVTVALLIGVSATSNDRRAAIAQEDAIRKAARESLERIATSPGFVGKPLDFTQDFTLKGIVKGAPDSAANQLFGV
jgi:hypothetical protein